MREEILFILCTLTGVRGLPVGINTNGDLGALELNHDLHTSDDWDDNLFLIIMMLNGVIFGGIAMFVVIFATLAVCLVKRLIMLNEDDLVREEENQAYLELESEEQELYFQSKDYLAANPYYRGETTLSQNLAIQEKGIQAFEFQKDSMLTNNDLIIINKYELNFFKKFECCSITNLPMPHKNEVYYFESKIYSLPDPENTMISIGLGVKPYPWFRLPGRHSHSVSYDSNGYRRHNQPFKFSFDPPFPKYIEGDVIGVGYRTSSGTIFFTRNGKKISESKIGGHIRNFKIANMGQLFPIIGANNLCSVHVNLGQAGFVFIEGNVKKWGFAPIEGNGPAPPAYNKFNGDILLERSEIDDEDILERENDFPPDFWEIHGESSTKKEEEDDSSIDHDKFSYNAYSDINSNDERITLNSLLPNRPPSYEGDDQNDEENNENNESNENNENNHNNESNHDDERYHDVNDNSSYSDTGETTFNTTYDPSDDQSSDV
jgi:hypothetical protein